MAVLLNVFSGQEQLFVGQDLLRLFRLHGALCHLGNLLRSRLILDKDPVFVPDNDAKIRILHRTGSNRPLIGLHRRQLRFHRGNKLPFHIQIDLSALMRRGRVDNDMRISMMKLQVHSRVDRGVLHLSHLLVGHEILREGLFLERLEPCEVRLVVRKYAAHQLNVGPVLIRQVPVPGLSEIAAAPGPLLFARGHMMIRDMQKARLDAVPTKS